MTHNHPPRSTQPYLEVDEDALWGGLPKTAAQPHAEMAPASPTTEAVPAIPAEVIPLPASLNTEQHETPAMSVEDIVRANVKDLPSLRRKGGEKRDEFLQRREEVKAAFKTLPPEKQKEVTAKIAEAKQAEKDAATARAAIDEATAPAPAPKEKPADPIFAAMLRKAQHPGEVTMPPSGTSKTSTPKPKSAAQLDAAANKKVNNLRAEEAATPEGATEIADILAALRVADSSGETPDVAGAAKKFLGEQHANQIITADHMKVTTRPDGGTTVVATTDGKSQTYVTEGMHGNPTPAPERPTYMSQPGATGTIQNADVIINGATGERVPTGGPTGFSHNETAPNSGTNTSASEKGAGYTGGQEASPSEDTVTNAEGLTRGHETDTIVGSFTLGNGELTSTVLRPDGTRKTTVTNLNRPETQPEGPDLEGLANRLLDARRAREADPDDARTLDALEEAQLATYDLSPQQRQEFGTVLRDVEGERRNAVEAIITNAELMEFSTLVQTASTQATDEGRARLHELSKKASRYHAAGGNIQARYDAIHSQAQAEQKRNPVPASEVEAQPSPNEPITDMNKAQLVEYTTLQGSQDPNKVARRRALDKSIGTFHGTLTGNSKALAEFNTIHQEADLAVAIGRIEGNLNRTSAEGLTKLDLSQLPDGDVALLKQIIRNNNAGNTVAEDQFNALVQREADIDAFLAPPPQPQPQPPVRTAPPTGTPLPPPGPNPNSAPSFTDVLRNMSAADINKMDVSQMTDAQLGEVAALITSANREENPIYLGNEQYDALVRIAQDSLGQHRAESDNRENTVENAIMIRNIQEILAGGPDGRLGKRLTKRNRKRYEGLLKQAEESRDKLLGANLRPEAKALRGARLLELDTPLENTAYTWEQAAKLKDITVKDVAMASPLRQVAGKLPLIGQFVKPKVRDEHTMSTRDALLDGTIGRDQILKGTLIYDANGNPLGRPRSAKKVEKYKKDFSENDDVSNLPPSRTERRRSAYLEGAMKSIDNALEHGVLQPADRAELLERREVILNANNPNDRLSLVEAREIAQGVKADAKIINAQTEFVAAAQAAVRVPGFTREQATKVFDLQKDIGQLSATQIRQRTKQVRNLIAGRPANSTPTRRALKATRNTASGVVNRLRRKNNP